ncbi:hypothetical protein [Opitutus sp. ER46]|uniref:hypothetical protein n=1 Tax=Opitutus sp. ER46 TaxID=2161864 RepID=UPI0018EE8EE4|nr:hypothetical protein [Opitutus sp. ER46]
MNPRFLLCGVVLVLALLSGCGKRADAPAAPAAAPAPKPVTLQVVPENERSQHFLAVQKHLEIGGTLYGYVDVDGDVQKVAKQAQQILTQIAQVQPQVAPFAKQDLIALATTLGLTDVKAMGISSVSDGTGYFRNRAFLYTPGERHGLLLGLGGKPGPFVHLGLAPADTAFYAEAELDLPVIYQTVKEIVAKVAGEPVGNQMETALKNAGQKAALSVLDLIHGMKGHSAIVVRMNPDQQIQLPVPGGAALPSFALLVCVDNIAPALEPALAKSPAFKRTDVGTQHVYEMAQPSPVKELQPVIVVDGSTLFFATTRAFLDECRALKTGLAQTPEYQKAIAALGNEGNGVVYLHPRLFDGLRKIESLNPNLPPQVKPMIANIVAQIPKIDRPLVAVRTNLPDGILFRSYWNRSMKQELVAVAMYNPVSVGLVAAMAIPAFQKVRASSQDKAVLNNLRQLSSAADQYYLETGKTTATYDDLVGPDKYVRQLHSVAGEDYRQLRFESGKRLRIRVQNRWVQYPNR